MAMTMFDHAGQLPITLAIDTARPRLQLGLVGRAGRVDVLIEEMATGHAEALFGCIAALLARNGLGYADLERVATTTGPGSFTGLRVGLSAARGIGLARQIPVLGIPSLLAVSLAGAAGKPLVVRLDARRGEVYHQEFIAPGVPAGPARLVPAETAVAAPEAGTVLETPFADMAALARFAAAAEPLAFPPDAAYVREADAKPQAGKAIARR